MNYQSLCLLLILPIFGVPACNRSVQTVPASPVDEKPLLLDDGPSILASQTGADNSRCHVCHLNYAMEEFAVKHAEAGIGCEQCHGASNAHCSDEDNITPPDRMFPRNGITEACVECHREKLPMTDVHKQVLARKAKEVCTDCHGEHRLSHRTRRWNKGTGKLIADDNVRMSDKRLQD